MAENGTTGNTISPILKPTWPKVQIGNQLLELNWGIVAGIMLTKWGIDRAAAVTALYEFDPPAPAVLDEQGNVVTPEQPGRAKSPNYVTHMAEIFAACVAHNYTKLEMDPPNGLHWATEADLNDCWDAMRTGVYEALGKKKPQATQTTTPTPGAVVTEQAQAVQ